MGCGCDHGESLRKEGDIYRWIGVLALSVGIMYGVEMGLNLCGWLTRSLWSVLDAADGEIACL